MVEKHKVKKNVSAIIAGLLLVNMTGCGTTEELTEATAVHPHSATIKHNQIGYYPKANKTIVIPSYVALNYSLRNEQGQVVHSGKSQRPAMWPLSGETVSKIDISSVQSPGNYRLNIEGSDAPTLVTIHENPYADMHLASMRAYYINRAGIALEPQYAGDFARKLGHPDTIVKVHSSAASEARPEGTIISSPKGWYDAGDYNKYIVNSGISTYMLLLAYEHFGELYKGKSFNIPESTNSTDDMLDEIAWNIEWMSTMQDPNDGGVYHKLTTLDFSPIMMPEEGTETRYVVQKSTAATLNFSAIMAFASRIYADIDTELSEKYLIQAINAYTWALNNPTQYYRQPEDVKTGEYGDDFVGDEFAWASAELFLSSTAPQFLKNFETFSDVAQVPSWLQSSALGYVSMLSYKNAADILPAETLNNARQRIITLADEIVKQHQASPYSVAMVASDFEWGSNGIAMNKAFVLWQAHRLTQQDQYREAAEGLVNYVLGTNPTGYSFVTGFGKITPVAPHHRQSAADNVDAPVPGFLVGGPHSGQQDSCNYPSALPAQSFLDDWCSYSTNEVTINWNAPFVYSLAQMQVLHGNSLSGN